LGELEGWGGGRPVRRLGAAADADVELRDALIHGRRPKDDVELERMRAAAEATRVGFEELVPLIDAGRTERELQVALEAAFLRNGGDFLAFETIVAAGDHAAVLHFAPTVRQLRDGDLLLVDAGAEHRGYASDVTRTYAVGGRFSAEAGARPRHRAARRRERDRRLPSRNGLTRRPPRGGAGGRGRASRARRPPRLARDAPRERRGDAVLPTRRRPPGRPRRPRHRPGLQRGARARARPAAPAHRHPAPPAPGVDGRAGNLRGPRALARERGRNGVDWDRADDLHGFGGVRFEQNVLITDDGCEILTAAVPL
jgi:hypothetical protein